MSLPRCRHCKSAVNPQRYAQCIGCGAGLDDVLPPSRQVRPRVLMEGTKDAGRSSGVLSVIGALGVVSFIPSIGSQNGYLMILASVMAITGTVAWIAKIFHKGQGRTGLSCLGMIAIMFLCGAALLFGLGILLGFTCIGNGGRFD